MERVPRLREILAAAHQECNQSGGTTGRIMDIFHEHVAGVFNHWTFTERHELEALALEALLESPGGKECQAHRGGIDPAVHLD